MHNSHSFTLCHRRELYQRIHLGLLPLLFIGRVKKETANDVMKRRMCCKPDSNTQYLHYYRSVWETRKLFQIVNWQLNCSNMHKTLHTHSFLKVLLHSLLFSATIFRAKVSLYVMVSSFKSRFDLLV